MIPNHQFGGMFIPDALQNAVPASAAEGADEVTVDENAAERPQPHGGDKPFAHDVQDRLPPLLVEHGILDQQVGAPLDGHRGISVHLAVEVSPQGAVLTAAEGGAASAKRDDVPDFRAGDTLKVHVKVVEGNRSRVQVFQGVCIRVQGSGIGRTFTVRKVSFGVGVERTFPLHSPIFEQIEIVTRGDVRRAKLYYLRNLRGKAAKIKERREA